MNSSKVVGNTIESVANDKYPADWDIQRFRHVFLFGKGLSITKDNLEDEGVPTVNYGEVHSKYGFELIPSKHALKCVSADYLKTGKSALLKFGDFVFADTSEDLQGSGNFTYLNGDEQVFAGYHTVIARLRPKWRESLDVRFLAYLLDSASFRTQVRKRVKGVKVYSITQSILKDTYLPIPPKNLQGKIARFLEEKVSKVDEAIAIKQKQIELLKERKQIIIQQAVTQGLNPDAPMKDSGVDWIGEIPEHWGIVRFKNLFTQSRLPVRKGDGVVTSYRDGQVTLRSNRRVGGYTEAILEGGYQGIRKGQLVLNSMDAFEGAIGVSDSDGKCTPEYVICDPINRVDVSQYYFAYLLREMALAKYIQVICNAVRQRAVRIRYNNLAPLFMVVPPVKEQENIVSFIEKESAKLDAGIKHLNEQISKLKEYKATLINSAVTGKIKVMELK
ncbi:restriction endonuclease subunit S [Vibrio parahaemolyticus]|uniref:restriction endonuclease subunit S n=1 Tax=Vibrio parahaemolyticus TaxID=670 RepID=UPI001EF8B5A5|nr:restriction endonuclease subunit S [Vibrio parahaemolyticus]MCG7824009.1 restriction endonuclease subunit S [Vibrio parahaemolyticus]